MSRHDFEKDYAELTASYQDRPTPSISMYSHPDGPPPVEPEDGDMWYNSTDKMMYVYNKYAHFWSAVK